jgi:putative spermidine/putrescine transport system permease protein
MKSRQFFALACLLPLGIILAAFFLIPLVRLFLIGGGGEAGFSRYFRVLTMPRYYEALASTTILSLAVTAATLLIGGIAGIFLARNRFPGHGLLVAILTFPLAFPGVVVGFMVIMLGGRLGIFGQMTLALLGERMVFAYSIIGLFVGYLYFSIPRVLLTVMGVAEKLDNQLIEAARSLGAGPFAVQRDIVLPALMPAFVAAGSICFATSMGAFGTAFTLAAKIDVLPMVIYNVFTESADMATAAALAVILGLCTWAVLALARLYGGTNVAAAG